MLRNILAGVLVAGLVVVLLFTERDWFLSDKYFAVSHAASLPADTSPEVLAELTQYVAQGGVHVPQKDSVAARLYAAATREAEGDEAKEKLAQALARAAAWASARPKLGYLVQEITFLGMPFGWHGDYGLSLVLDVPEETMAAPLGESGRALLARTLGGKDPAQGSFFPFWQHMWGWFFLAGVAAWGVMRQQWVARRREAEGLI